MQITLERNESIMSIALHWVVDLLILGPTRNLLGVLFGIHIDGGHHG